MEMIRFVLEQNISNLKAWSERSVLVYGKRD